MTLGRWLGLFAIITSVYILWQIRSIVFLLLAAIVVATTLNRLVRRYRESNVKRGYAVLLAVTVILGLLGAILAILLALFIDQFDQLLSLIPISIDQIQVWSSDLQSRIPEGMMDDLPSLTSLTQELQSAANWVISNIYNFFSNSLELFLNLLFVFVWTVMLLANPQQYRQGLIKLFPAFYRHRADEILIKCEVRLVHYIGGMALNMIFVGITATVGLVILDVPLPVVNGLLAGLSAFVPYVGAIASVIPPILLALLDEPWKAVIVLLLYFLIQQIEGKYVAPLIMHRQIDPFPAITLALLTVFFTFFGVLGLVLGVPILVILQTWVEEAIIHDILDPWRGHQNSI